LEIYRLKSPPIYLLEFPSKLLPEFLLAFLSVFLSTFLPPFLSDLLPVFPIALVAVEPVVFLSAATIEEAIASLNAHPSDPPIARQPAGSYQSAARWRRPCQSYTKGLSKRQKFAQVRLHIGSLHTGELAIMNDESKGKRGASEQNG
jgi:hypothetical protein